ncbi:serine protease inhibitor ecotin [Sphingomonas sp. F9_3S_D5_B_2]
MGRCRDRRAQSRAVTANIGNIRMKQMNVWPMVILLVVVLYLIWQLRPHG